MDHILRNACLGDNFEEIGRRKEKERGKKIQAEREY